MAKENFNLQWENHNQLIASTFKRLYEDETLTDVTVYCKDGPLRAHKLVLSICSPYFNRIYQMNPGVHMVVMVYDLQYIFEEFCRTCICLMF